MVQSRSLLRFRARSFSSLVARFRLFTFCNAQESQQARRPIVEQRSGEQSRIGSGCSVDSLSLTPSPCRPNYVYVLSSEHSQCHQRPPRPRRFCFSFSFFLPLLLATPLLPRSAAVRTYLPEFFHPSPCTYKCRSDRRNGDQREQKLVPRG